MVNRKLFIYQHTNMETDYLNFLYRSGCYIFGRWPAHDVCSDLLFSPWPHALFDETEKEYSEVVRLTLGLTADYSLPPLTALVLSRAPTRNKIITTIQEMRLQYEESRKQFLS